MSIEIPASAKLAYTRDTASYYPSMVETISRNLKDHLLSEMRMRGFDNGMPLYTVSDEALHALLIAWISGDNWQSVFTELALVGSALTLNPDAAGPNVERLGILLPFVDARQDSRSRKAMPKPSKTSSPSQPEKVAIVKKQYVFTLPLARMLSSVAGASYVATLDLHSYKAARAFQDNGLEVINLTAMKEFAKAIQESGVCDDSLETVVCTTDLGDLNRVLHLSQLLKVPLAIINKHRYLCDDETSSYTEQELIYGQVRGKRVIIPDDMISSGGTLIHAVELLLQLGAKEVILCATHPIFADGYYDNLRTLLRDERVKLVITTNSLPIEERRSVSLSIPYVGKGVDRREIKVLDLAPLLTQAVITLLSTPNLAEAKALLGDNVMDIVDQYDLYHAITGKRLPRPMDAAIYREGEYTAL